MTSSSSSAASSSAASSSAAGASSSYGDSGSYSGSGSTDYSSSYASHVDVPQVELRWKNVLYSVETTAPDPTKPAPPPQPLADRLNPFKKEPTRTQVILDDVSGAVQPGRALAIMGPSGSGKTSLLNVLSGRISTEHNDLTGSITINGEPVTTKLLKTFSAYVSQVDILTGTLTPREALLFQARLRLPPKTKEDEIQARVNGLIKELGLNKCADTLIGFTGQDALNSGLKRGISGGERKRLSIAMELITNPSLIFLDEPTTGLDSFSALSVVNTITNLASHGRSVIFTIHQPSDEIFSLFDNLLLLGLGRTVYYGERTAMLPYFAEMGYKCPKWENPADYILRIVHVDTRQRDDELADLDDDLADALSESDSTSEAGKAHRFEVAASQVAELADAYAESDLAADVKESEKDARIKGFDADPERSHHASSFYAIYLIVGRQLKNLIREPMQLMGNLFQAIFFGLLMGAIFWRLDHDQKSIQDRSGGIFFGSIFMLFGALLGPVYLFPAERHVFKREYQNGMYGVFSYFFGRIMAEIPKICAGPIIFGSIFYWMLNLNDSGEAFVVFLAVLLLQSLLGFTFGLFFVSAFPDPAIALAVLPVAFIPLFLLSGFYIASNSIPDGLVWLEALSFTKYTFRMLMKNEFEGVAYYCTAEELSRSNNVCPHVTGDTYLAQRGFDKGEQWSDLVICLAFASVFTIFSFIFLRISAKRQK